jgi:hypothetical protein
LTRFQNKCVTHIGIGTMHSIPIMPWHWEMGYSGLLQVDINKGNQPQFFIDVRWFWTKLCNLTYDVIFPVAIFFLNYYFNLFFNTRANPPERLLVKLWPLTSLLGQLLQACPGNKCDLASSCGASQMGLDNTVQVPRLNYYLAKRFLSWPPREVCSWLG